MKPTVAVALSGGLDSAVAASLLKEKGARVMGIHFFTGYEAKTSSHVPHPISSLDRAEKIAALVDIPLHTFDCSRAFSEKVIHYFVETYRCGMTPNPCVVCNQHIKFGALWDHARQLGAQALATGHYVRLFTDPHGGTYLLKGRDPGKDQSYFLCRLTQQQLKQAVFPLGGLTKEDVRKIAALRGLKELAEQESQELCFIDDTGYRAFLAGYGMDTAGPGLVVNRQGEVLGEHQGLHRHTIGQRKGLGIPGPEPYYVLKLDRSRNRLVVGTKEELAANHLRVVDINWIGLETPRSPLTVKTRIRYRHKEVPSVVNLLDAETAEVSLMEPQYAITPGQAAVLYDGERVLGGGWIASSEDFSTP